MDNTRATYHNYVEQSQDEIQQLRNEHMKALEKITKSRDEFYNQLQTVRKKWVNNTFSSESSPRDIL